MRTLESWSEGADVDHRSPHTQMITNGSTLTLRRPESDETTTGRVVEATPVTLGVRVGRFPWLRPGASLVCLARDGDALRRFTTRVESVSTHGPFVVNLYRTLSIEDANRRSEPRLAGNHRLLWTQAVQGRIARVRHEGLTTDVSVGGMSFTTDVDPPEVGSRIAVSARLPVGDLLAVSRVTGVDDSSVPLFSTQHHVRVAIESLSPAYEASLRQWIDQTLGGTPMSLPLT